MENFGSRARTTRSPAEIARAEDKALEADPEFEEDTEPADGSSEVILAGRTFGRKPPPAEELPENVRELMAQGFSERDAREAISVQRGDLGEGVE